MKDDNKLCFPGHVASEKDEKDSSGKGRVGNTEESLQARRTKMLGEVDSLWIFLEHEAPRARDLRRVM